VPPYEPQVPTLVKHAPDGEEWLHEIKYDGYRIGCRVEGGEIGLWSRNGREWTMQFPEVCDAVRRLGLRDALLDGEVAIVLPDGRTSFQALQNARSGGTRQSLVYYVFDLLHLDDVSFMATPLEVRKARLLQIVSPARESSRIRYSDHVVGGGDRLFAEACRLGLEGIVSKRRDAIYRPGRNTDWLKTKCTERQEFVIGGFTDPEGLGHGIGGLLIGQHDAEGRLIFTGKVGTGLTHRAADDLRRTLEARAIAKSPFAGGPTGWPSRNVHWVRPELVAEVAFAEWTTDGKVRHPSFQGLRDDAAPRTVRLGRGSSPAAIEPPPSSPGAAVRPHAPVNPPARRARSAGPEVEVAGVRLTHPDRVLFPDIGLTKLDLARYSEQIGRWILPHLAGRPLTLVQCPDGLGGPCHYMKHSKVWSPPALRRVRIQEKTKLGEYLVADSLAAVVSLAQMNVLEIHTWNAIDGDVERPNRLVFDMDPGEDVTWRQVVEAARVMRSLLRALGLESFVKTTGGRGLHVLVPLVPHADWRQCLAFSRGLSAVLVAREPDRYTTSFPKAGRERKILVDYLRNNRTNTSVAAFSTRARPRAPVSVPLRWEELGPTLRSDHYTIATIERRLGRLREDPWKSYWTARQRLEPAMLDALSSL
jgi:bifunctional non-homologous end joining protein LigD